MPVTQPIGQGTVRVLADTSRAERSVQRLLGQINSPVNFRVNARSFTEPLGRITGKAQEFDKSLAASNARVLAFGASAGIIYAIDRAFRALVRTTVDVEKRLSDINVILGANNTELQSFGNELFNIAKNTGQAFSVVADAALELSRQGLGVKETLLRTRDALILTRLSGLAAAESVETLTAAINGFSAASLNSTQIINKLANVDAAFAVSANDLAEALKRVGSTAVDAGVSFDELLGLVTAVQQTTARGGAVIGNALKSILTRIGRPSTLEQLRALGVEIDNSQTGVQKLQALADALQKADADSSTLIKQLAGGVYQVNIVAAALADLSKEYSIFSKATQTAVDAQDEAIQRSERLNETLAALVNRTVGNIQEAAAAIGKISFGPTIRNYLTSFNTLLEKTVNQDTESVGQKVGQGILSGLGQFLSGPGIALVGLLAGKFFAKFIIFARDSLKDLFIMNEAYKQQARIQEHIRNVLASEPKLLEQIANGSLNINQAQELILTKLKQEIVLRQQITNLARATAGKVLQAGLFVSPISDQLTNIRQPAILKQKFASGQPLPLGAVAQGLIPNYANIGLAAITQEKFGAYKGGYRAGSIKTRNVQGIGPVVYNSAEQVKDVGLKQPAIMPPRGTEAGAQYLSSFKSKFGINPYTSEGLIPNFAGGPYRMPRAGFVKFFHNYLARGGVKGKLVGLDIIGSPDSKSRTFTASPPIHKGRALPEGSARGFYDRTIPFQEKRLPFYVFSGPGAGQRRAPYLSNIRGFTFKDKKYTLTHRGLIPNFASGGHPNDYRSLLQSGWEYIGSGAESFVFKKKGVVFKVRRPDASPIGENLANKAKVTVGASKVFEKAGLPIEAKRVRTATIGGYPGTIQRYAGPTFGNVLEKSLPPSSLQYQLQGSILDYIERQMYSLRGEPQGRYNQGLYLGVDTGSPHNFSLGRPERFSRVVKNLTKIPSTLISDKNQKLMRGLVKTGKFRAIDLAGYAKGLTPNFAGYNFQYIKPKISRSRKDLDLSLANMIDTSGFGPRLSALAGGPVAFQFASPPRLGRRVGGQYELGRTPDILLNRDRILGDIQRQITQPSLYSPQRRTVATLTHELGHRIDWQSLRGSDPRFSQSAQFKKAIENDKQQYGRYLNELASVSIDANPYSESFAELIGRYTTDIPFSRRIPFAGPIPRREAIPFQNLESFNLLQQKDILPFNQGLVPNFAPVPTIRKRMDQLTAQEQAQVNQLLGRTVTLRLDGHAPRAFREEVAKYGPGIAQALSRQFVIDNLSNIQAVEITKAGKVVGMRYVVPRPKNSLVDREMNIAIMFDDLTDAALANARAITMFSTAARSRETGRIAQFQQPTASKGFIPNFALDPIKAAMLREYGAGIDPSRVRLGRHSALMSPINPRGYGVYNTKDEPAGLSQGINKVKSMGLDPKFFGAAMGVIPNFAEPFRVDPTAKFTTPTGMSTVFNSIKDVEAELNAQFKSLQQKVKSGTLAYGNLTKATEELIKDYRVTDTDAKRMRLAMQQTELYWQKQKESLAKQNADLDKLTILQRGRIKTYASATTQETPRPPLVEGPKIRGKQTPLITAAEAGLRRATTQFPDTRQKGFEKFTYRGETLERPAGSNLTPVPGLQRLLTAIEEPRRAGILEFELAQRRAELNRRRGQGPTTPEEVIAYQQGPQLGRHLANALSEQIIEQQKAADYQNRLAGATTRFSAIENKLTGVFSGRRGGSLYKEAEALGKEFSVLDERLKQMTSTRLNRIQNTAFITSFVGPMVTSTISEFIGQSTRGRRLAGAGVGAFGQALTFGGFGATLTPANPLVGGAIGAAVGGGIGVANFFKQLNDQLPELERRAEIAADKLNKVTNGLQLYVTGLEEYQNALSDTSGRVDAAALERRRKQLTTVLLEIPREYRSQITSAIGDTEKLSSIFSKLQTELGNAAKFTDTLVKLQTVIQSQRRFEAPLFRGRTAERDFSTFFSDITSAIDINKIDVTKLNTLNNELDNIIKQLPRATATVTRDTALVTQQGGNLNGLLRDNEEQQRIVEQQRQRQAVATTFAEVFKLPPELKEQLTPLFEQNEDVIRFSVALREYITDVQNATQVQKDISEITKRQTDTNKRIISETDDLNKALNNLYTSLNNITSLAASRVLNANTLKFGEAGFRRNIGGVRAEGLLKQAEPFLEPERIAGFDTELKQLELRNKQLTNLEAEIIRAQEGYLDVINKQFDKSAKTVAELLIKTSRQEQLSAEEKTKLSIGSNQVKALTDAFIKSIAQIQQNPEAILSQTEFLKTTGLTTEEANVTASNILQVLQDSKNNISQILADTKRSIAIEQLQADIQQKILTQQRELAIGGGAADFLGGSKNFDELTDLLRNTIRNRLLPEPTRSLETGRTAFQFADYLRNTLQLPGDFSAQLTELSVRGREQDLLRQLNGAETLARQTLGGEDLNQIVIAIDDLKQRSYSVAEKQIAQQLKLSDLPGITSEVKVAIKELHQLQTEQYNNLQAQNKNAFQEALQATSLDQLPDATTNITELLKNINLTQQQLLDITSKGDLLRKREGTEAGIVRNAADVKTFTTQLQKTQSEIYNRLRDSGASEINQKATLALIRATRSQLIPTPAKTTQTYGLVAEARPPDLEQVTKLLEETQIVPDSLIKSWANLMNSLQNSTILVANLTTALNKTNNDLAAIDKRAVSRQPIAPTPADFAPKLQSVFSGTLSQFKEIYALIKPSNVPTTPGVARSVQAPTVTTTTPAPALPTATESRETLRTGLKTSDITQINNALERLTKINTENLTTDLAIAEAQLLELSKNGNVFSDAIVTARQNVNTLKAQLGTLTTTDVFAGLLDTWRYKSEDVFLDLSNDAIQFGKTMKESFAASFSSFIKGSESASNAFRNFGLSIVDQLINISSKFATNQLFNVLGKGIQAVAPKADDTKLLDIVGSLVGGNTGGYIKKYATGGRVTGGSGVRDDIPALLKSGEYVLNKQAVQNIGVDILDQINSTQSDRIYSSPTGSVFASLTNQLAYLDDPKRPNRGQLQFSPYLSAFALEDENNPQNVLRKQREQTLLSYLGSRAEYQRQQKDALNQFKKAQKQRIIGAFINAAVGLASTGINQALSKQGAGVAAITKEALNQYVISQAEKDFTREANDIVNNISKFNSIYSGANINSRTANRGGLLTKRYEEGGSVDSVPAMLTGGEYVMNRQTVDRYGVGFFDQLNGQRVRFAEGGLVGRNTVTYPVDTNTNDNFDRIIDELSTINQELSRFVGQRDRSVATINPLPSNSPATNNVNITINVSETGKVNAETRATPGTSNTQQDNSRSLSDPRNSTQFAELIENAVLKVIIEQQRNGGLLPKRTY